MVQECHLWYIPKELKRGLEELFIHPCAVQRIIHKGEQVEMNQVSLTDEQVNNYSTINTTDASTLSFPCSYPTFPVFSLAHLVAGLTSSFSKPSIWLLGWVTLFSLL